MINAGDDEPGHEGQGDPLDHFVKWNASLASVASPNHLDIRPAPRSSIWKASNMLMAGHPGGSLPGPPGTKPPGPA